MTLPVNVPLSVEVVTQHPRTQECCCSCSASHPRILPCFHQERHWRSLWSLGSVENERGMNTPCWYICPMLLIQSLPTLWFLQVYYCAKVSSENDSIALYFKYYETSCNMLHRKLFQIDNLSADYRVFLWLSSPFIWTLLPRLHEYSAHLIIHFGFYYASDMQFYFLLISFGLCVTSCQQQ